MIDVIQLGFVGHFEAGAAGAAARGLVALRSLGGRAECFGVPGAFKSLLVFNAKRI